ncbi:MAG: hypothetical protein MJZ79_01970 [Paludibacteraceae bacterium]|nr:hypothetical protein [Paludibacteraceae bacterium]
MKKILTFALALFTGVSLMATDVIGTNIYRYVYTDYATGNPYYSLQINDADWNSYYFGFKSANGPMVGQTYTIDDMITEQTYASINWQSDPITSLTFTRSYSGLQEQMTAAVTTQSGAQYNISWAANVPAQMGDDVDLDTTIVCDFRDNGAYKTFTPLVTDYNYYNFTIAIVGDLPTVGQEKTYTWKANSIYIGNASFSLPNDWNTKAFDAKYTITGIDGGYQGTAEYSMTDGHKYIFGFSYTIPHVEETVNLSGYDMKINNWGTVVFAWQNETYSVNLAINSADTLGNWKGNDIILGNCSFQHSATYTDLGVYAIDSIYVTKTEEGYIRLQTSILCKNNTLYVLDVTNQESPYYVKYDTDGTGVKWQNIPAAQYGTGRTMGVRYNNDSIWFNAEPTDEGAAGYSIKDAYDTYGDPLWEKDSITISYDPNTSWGSPLSVYMAEKYYDAILDVELSSRSYENVDGDGVWNYSFGYGSYMEGNHYAFNFGIYGPITAPKQYTTYTLNDMTEDYRTKGYDPEFNEFKYDVVTLSRELDWSANEAEKITVNVHTTDGKAYKLIYAADTIPVATDTIEFAPIKADIRQQEYWFQFEGEGVANEANYRFQLALAGEEVTPTTYYWKQNDFYKPGTIIYNNSTGHYVDIADAWTQVNATYDEETLTGYGCNAYLLGYDGHCYHAYLKYTVPVAEDTIGIECKDLQISNYYQNNINYSAFNNLYRVNINIATADTFGVFKAEVTPSECSVGLNFTPFTSAQGYSVDSFEVSKDEKGIIHLTGGILCKDNHYYSIHLSTEVTPYYLGVANEEGTVEWFDMVQGFYQSGAASGAWDYETVVYNDDKVYINTAKELDGNESIFPFAQMPTIDDQQIEKYDTVNFQYNVYFKEVYATSVKKYQEPTDLKDARFEQAPVVKYIENNRIIIERYGRKYDVLGR